jgi:hypothetical protein
VFQSSGQNIKDRHVNPGESAVIKPKFYTSPPCRLGGNWPNLPGPGHQQVCMQCSFIIEADQEMLSNGIGADQCASTEVNPNESWIAGDRLLATLTSKPSVDFVGEAPNGVALRHYSSDAV